MGNFGNSKTLFGKCSGSDWEVIWKRFGIVLKAFAKYLETAGKCKTTVWEVLGSAGGARKVQATAESAWWLQEVRHEWVKCKGC